MAPTRCVLVSTYEQGHQPLGLASAAAALRLAGHEVVCADASVDRLPPGLLDGADLIAISVPMHTAARLGVALARQIRASHPRAFLAFYGVYASPLRALLTRLGLADAAVGGEYEPALVATADDLAAGRRPVTGDRFARGAHPLPDRHGLPALDRYARLRIGDELRLAGYAEASRGCAHVCTHCPLTPVYGGRLRLVDPRVVLADIDRQVDAGARHITFGDPDFLNAAAHAAGIAEALHQAHPAVTFDVTAKVEHLLEHRDLLSRLRDLGCLFITSAFESTDDAVLARLGKGHSAADLERVLAHANAEHLVIRPTWMAFTPWTTGAAYLDLLRFVEAHDLIEHVQPVQYGLRLLLPPGSALLPAVEASGALGGFDEDGLTFTWRNPDDRLERLQAAVAAVAAETASHDCGAAGGAYAAFERVREAAWQMLSGSHPPPLAPRAPKTVPGLTENWFC